jgi:hypothetical protein
MGKAGWPADRRVRRLIWFGGLLVAAAVVAVLVTVVFRPASHSRATAPARATHPVPGPSSPARSASHPASSASHPTVTWEVAGPVADLSVPLPGMPPVANPANIYADAGANMLSPAVRGVP